MLSHLQDLFFQAAVKTVWRGGCWCKTMLKVQQLLNAVPSQIFLRVALWFCYFFSHGYGLLRVMDGMLVRSPQPGRLWLCWRKNPAVLCQLEPPSRPSHPAGLQRNLMIAVASVIMPDCASRSQHDEDTANKNGDLLYSPLMLLSCGSCAIYTFLLDITSLKGCLLRGQNKAFFHCLPIISFCFFFTGFLLSNQTATAAILDWIC